MLIGLEILLARAKEYPEEFSNPNGKWRLLIKEILPYLDKDEMIHLEMAMKDVMRSKFNEAVLTTLAGVEAQQPEQEQSGASGAWPQKALSVLNAQFDTEYARYQEEQEYKKRARAGQRREQFKDMAGLKNPYENNYR
jgi:hypothetical protein